MLSIGRLSAGSEDYYLSLTGTEDYYTHAGEAPGYWTGHGSALLGLDGRVEPDALRELLAGRHPRTGEPLAEVTSAPRRPGFDLTFSAPKGVSLLAALAPPAVRAAVRDGHRQAVAEALEYLQEHATFARRGHAGAELVATDGLLAAAFVHRTSRNLDPQLHTHVLVVNVVHGADGRWSTPAAQLLYRHANAAGHVYHAALRASLAETLGLQWGPARNGMAEPAGFSAEQLAVFSTRRAEIVAALDGRDLSSPAAARVAALDTRTAKTAADVAHLEETWQARGAHVGLTAEVLARLCPGRPRQTGIGLANADEIISACVGTDGLTAGRAVFERRDVVRAVATRTPTGAHLADVDAVVDHVLAHPAVVALAAGRAERTFTTRALLDAEEFILASAEHRRDTHVAVVDPSTLAAALAGRALSGEQEAMVERLTRDGDGVTVVVGVAGAGKTTALDAARQAWTAEGIQVVGCALAARAAAELEAGAHISSQTVDRLLIDLRTPGPFGGLAPGSVVVVDEAGMVGTRHLAELAGAAARADAKLVLCGDPRQLPSVAAGGGLAALAARLPVIELTENRRQHDPWQREALAEMRHGDPARALAAYRRAGSIVIATDARATRAQMIEDWWQRSETGATVGMYAPGRVEVAELNREARTRMRAEGRLGREEVRVAGEAFSVGDHVLCLRNDRRLDVRNGTEGVVSALHPDGGITMTTRTGARSLPAAYLEGGQLTLGYARTIHKAQGATVDHALVLGSDRLFREAAYVSLSRGRATNTCYLAGGGPDRDIHDPRRAGVDPLRALTGALGTSRAQMFATALDGRPPPPSPDPRDRDLEIGRSR